MVTINILICAQIRNKIKNVSGDVIKKKITLKIYQLICIFKMMLVFIFITTFKKDKLTVQGFRQDCLSGWVLEKKSINFSNFSA